MATNVTEIETNQPLLAANIQKRYAVHELAQFTEYYQTTKLKFKYILTEKIYAKSATQNLLSSTSKILTDAYLAP